MSTDPLFMKQDGQYYWYQNDHLGTPQKLTTTSGAVVWSAKHTSFGKAAVDPSSTVANPLRLPGQYEDVETGLYYNWFRYYDTNIGRYLRADPLRFYAGINFFEYVHSNPLRFIDPFGLQTGAPSVPGAPGFPPVLPPVFYPGTPENDIFVRDVNRIIDFIVDLIRAPFLEARRKKDQDPPWVKDLPREYDPGRYPNGKCKPCKDSPPFKHPEQKTHPCKGHQIRYRQDPVTCKCYAYRHNF